MDQYHNPDGSNPSTSLFQLNVDAQNSFTLRNAASWARLLGVAGIIAGITILLWIVIILTRVEQVSRGYGGGGSRWGDVFEEDGAVGGSTIMGIAAIIFIIGGLFSFKFGNRINAALKLNNQEGLNAGFAALRNYFALRSITMIVVILLMLLTLASST